MHLCWRKTAGSMRPFSWNMCPCRYGILLSLSRSHLKRKHSRCLKISTLNLWSPCWASRRPILLTSPWGSRRNIQRPQLWFWLLFRGKFILNSAKRTWVPSIMSSAGSGMRIYCWRSLNWSRIRWIQSRMPCRGSNTFSLLRIPSGSIPVTFRLFIRSYLNNRRVLWLKGWMNIRRCSGWEVAQKSFLQPTMSRPSNYGQSSIITSLASLPISVLHGKEKPIKLPESGLLKK